MRFLLSDVAWLLEVYGFDGFRFDGAASMLYHSHGIGKGHSGGYHEYFGPDAAVATHTYLRPSYDLICTVVPRFVTVGEDVSGMLTLCRGYGSASEPATDMSEDPLTWGVPHLPRLPDRDPGQSQEDDHQAGDLEPGAHLGEAHHAGGEDQSLHTISHPRGGGE